MRKVLVALAAVAAAVVAVIVIAEPFASNPAKAALGELRFEDCFASNGADGCADPSPNSTVLAGAVDATVSPDGKSVYVGGGYGLSHFNRSADGALSYADCVQNGGNNECANPSPGNNPLTGPKHIAVSPDGKSVYVTAEGTESEPGGNSLSVLSRNSTTGSLSFSECFGNLGGCTNPSGSSLLDEAAQVAVSADGKSVYATARGSSSLSRFNRNTTTGALTFAECFAAGEANGCNDPSDGNNPLGKAWDVAVSPDGKSVYVDLGIGVNSLSRFNRNTATGALTYAGCFGDGTSGCVTRQRCPQRSGGPLDQPGREERLRRRRWHRLDRHLQPRNRRLRSASRAASRTRGRRVHSPSSAIPQRRLGRGCERGRRQRLPRLDRPATPSPGSTGRDRIDQLRRLHRGRRQRRLRRP